MYARVAIWEGMSPETMKSFSDMINREDRPPAGVPSTGITVLNQPDSGRSIVIGFFESEDDLRKGDEALRAMDRPPESSGDITSIEFYEVGVEKRM